MKELVFLEWNDCAMYGTDQVSEKEAEGYHLVRMLSVGFLVKEDKQKIILAQDWHPDDKQVRKVTVYPRSGITHIIRMNVEKIQKKGKNNASKLVSRTNIANSGNHPERTPEVHS